ncbi:3-hydroxyisobutyrate dehydrogenase-like beta-hydroxyacid dehydrogenase [Bacillus thermophilus]|uniref:3-hydroxyisobutyrate dehydrogenase-like beta-hydroxyacid dehydrogenase n=1 Tax=Siminovitchia thermophila TaxID=1245522 RepID=A0ABS2R4S2_9BACI|nr:NAD(P)-dependent oxidoreductase [Siminovitchia thermophila]MBM7714617.1 3-hydroxyisobutyrate dehydrogenase-like beta-hydroxyacid dehydrogenase [Siminovitchia thermophila]ONK22666.1 hypothetical protein BLX87_14925 [Bacillus sp. VT-16-64]
MKIVGVVGCGAMGSGMVKNLLKHQYRVVTYDPDLEKQTQMKELGAQPVSHFTEMGEHLDYLLLSLPASELIKETIIGREGILPRLKKGAAILDMSTTDVHVTKELFETCKEAGVNFFDCPVSNGPQGAQEGTLTIMTGGDSDRFEEILPILQAIGKEIHYVGSSGSGQVVKLCNNMVVAGITLLMSEALHIAGKVGVDPQKMMKIMQKSSAENKVMYVFGPNIIEQSHEKVVFMLNHMQKDVDLFFRLTKSERAGTLLSPLIRSIFAEAQKKGWGHLDMTAVSCILRDLDDQEE